jgi:hypothetical protein
VGSITINPLTPDDLQRRRGVSPLKIKIRSKKLGRQRCAVGFNFGIKGLIGGTSERNNEIS